MHVDEGSKNMEFRKRVRNFRLHAVMRFARMLGVPVQVHQSYFVSR